MTSKMRSIYLEGYDYSIFDLTIPDRVLIQVFLLHDLPSNMQFLISALFFLFYLKDSFQFSVKWSKQIHGNSVDGRILHGNSPCELIERFTETIGRQPELPEWIISGAIVGMQGGTEAVRHIWNELKAYELPISAFWLQVIPLPCKERERD